MRRTREPRQTAVCFKVTNAHRHLLEQLAAQLTIKRGKKHTLTDVVEEGLSLLAKKHGVKVGG